MATMTRDTVETRVFGVLRIVTIVLLLIITIFPFYYMGLLSLRPLDRVLQDPGALWVPPSEVNLGSYGAVAAPPSAVFSAVARVATLVRNRARAASASALVTPGEAAVPVAVEIAAMVEATVSFQFGSRSALPPARESRLTRTAAL